MERAAGIGSQRWPAQSTTKGRRVLYLIEMAIAACLSSSRSRFDGPGASSEASSACPD